MKGDNKGTMFEQAQLGWEETSERCRVLLSALNLIKNFHDCPTAIRSLAKNAINWIPGTDEFADYDELLNAPGVITGLLKENERLHRQLEQIQDARLTWAMTCECSCEMCDSFHNFIRDICIAKATQS